MKLPFKSPVHHGEDVNMIIGNQFGNSRKFARQCLSEVDKQIQMIVALQNQRFFSRVSKLFFLSASERFNAVNASDSSASLSQTLSTRFHLIHPSPNTPGCFHTLPLFNRSLEKLCALIDDEFFKIECLKVSMASLASSHIWDLSGRLKAFGSDMMSFDDRKGRKLCLSPTHEEAITSLLSDFQINENNLPIRIYQTTTKFRDELRPKHGMLRSREFLMNDLYSFDATKDSSSLTYEVVSNVYLRIFKRLGLDVQRVIAASGEMGGDLSHEYHLLSNVGQDEILICNSCSFRANVEVSGHSKYCPKCNTNDVSVHSSIEIGHTFQLDTTYSSPFNAFYSYSNGKRLPLQMGCYGIGISRLILAGIEILSPKDASTIVWPSGLSPYSLAIVPPKRGSKEGVVGEDLFHKFLCDLENSKCDIKDCIVDDRVHMTIGRRLHDMRSLGIKNIVVFGKGVIDELNPHVEFISQQTTECLQIPDFTSKCIKLLSKV